MASCRTDQTRYRRYHQGGDGVPWFAEYISEGGGVNIPAILASLAGFVTLVTFMAKSIYRVRPGEQAIRLRRKKIARVKGTEPIQMKQCRRYYWFGPVAKDEEGQTLYRAKRHWWGAKALVKPPKDLKDQLSTEYGEIEVLGPGVYFAMFLLGEIIARNTQDNADSVIHLTVETHDKRQLDVDLGLTWGVKHSMLGQFFVGLAAIRGMNNLHRHVELPSSDALRVTYESDLTWEQLGNAQLVFILVYWMVKAELDEYGLDLRKVKVLNRHRSLGQMIGASDNTNARLVALGNGHINGHNSAVSIAEPTH